MAIKTKKLDKSTLIEGSITKGLILFALPFLLSNVLQHLYHSVDALIVEMVVGSNAYNGVMQSGKVSQVLIGFFTGISVGASVVVSQYFGAKDKDNIKKSVHTTIIMSVIFGIILTVAGLVLSPYILKAIKTQEADYGYALTYLRIYFVGVILFVVYNMGAGILRAIGDTLTPLIFLAIAAVINVIADLILIPRFGVAGAAWATIISQGTATVLVLLRLFFAKGDYRLRFRDMKFDAPMFKKIFRIGLPVGITNSIVSLAHLFMTGFYNEYSSAEITGTYHYSVLDGFIYMPLNSFSMALSTFVGQNVGAGKYDRAKKAVRRCLTVSMGVTVCICALVYIFRFPLLDLFEHKASDMVSAGTMSYFQAADNKQLMLETSIKFMTVMVLSYPILVVTDTLAGAIRGAGQAFVPAVITVSGMCFFRIIFLYATRPFFDDILVVFLNYPVSWIICAVALVIYYNKGNWRSKGINKSQLNIDKQLSISSKTHDEKYIGEFVDNTNQSFGEISPQSFDENTKNPL